MSELTKAIKYELHSNLDSLKKYDTWITFCIVGSVLLFIAKQFVISIILLFILLVLNAARNYSTGKVTEFFRKQYREPIKNECPK